jgi:hypothetical protein
VESLGRAVMAGGGPIPGTGPQPGAGPGPEGPERGGRAPEPGTRRPLLERLGLAAIAAVLALLFGGVAVASWVGGEVFLSVMAGIGALMTAWAGAMTLFRS